ncbi:hypothetical protein B7P43_G05981 [Cryptotermes secundus]|uniref:Hemimethylated DNA-binding domain-containing protein n=1 Tax=Cryptotermes secundus TaxID=105785 RepID=A0A2J7RDS3_9NEOP|nr:hypothetical protein B7P43_G05981 [Cryptotermes secundus]
MKPRCDLAECSKERYSSKRDVLPMMVMISLDYSRRQNGAPEVVENIKSFTTENYRVIPLGALTVPDDFTSTHADESPAVEVLKYREKAGYFATSLEVRNKRPLHLRYRIGQVVKHRTLGYKGVIVGWDLQAKAPESWLQHQYGSSKALRNWPHYAVLVDGGDITGSHVTYVVQKQLELMKNTEDVVFEQVRHHETKEKFEYFDGAQYIPRERLRILYPKD